MSTIAIDSCPYRSLAQIARRIPSTKGDRPVHPATLTRWILRGAKAPDGTVIKLEARKFPGGWKVTEEAVERFLDRLTQAALGEPVEVPTSQAPPPGAEMRAAEAMARMGTRGFVCEPKG
jgi:hypothetical protein